MVGRTTLSKPNNSIQMVYKYDAARFTNIETYNRIIRSECSRFDKTSHEIEK